MANLQIIIKWKCGWTIWYHNNSEASKSCDTFINTCKIRNHKIFGFCCWYMQLRLICDWRYYWYWNC